VLFDGATFVDLSKGPGRPYLTISATDTAAATCFEFVQEQFDMMCADLGRYSVTRAVAASAAVPLLMSPIMLSNCAGRCGYPSTTAIDLGLQARRLSSRQLPAPGPIRAGAWRRASLASGRCCQPRAMARRNRGKCTANTPSQGLRRCSAAPTAATRPMPPIHRSAMA